MQLEDFDLRASFATYFIISIILLLLPYGPALWWLWTVYTLYKLTKVRNEHFNRSFKRMKKLLVRLGLYDRLKERLSTLKPSPRSPLANAMLSMLPPYAFFLLYLLWKDLREHSLKEASLYSLVAEALKEEGLFVVSEIDVERLAVKERPWALYALVTFLTAGLFAFYCLYAYMKDFNEHLSAQASLDSSLWKHSS